MAFKEALLVATLAFTQAGPTVGSHSEFDENNYDHRTAILTPREAVVCLSDNIPSQTIRPNENLQPYSVTVERADCVATDVNGNSRTLIDVRAELYNMYGAEIIDLTVYRDLKVPIPEVFSTIPGGAQLPHGSDTFPGGANFTEYPQPSPSTLTE